MKKSIYFFLFFLFLFTGIKVTLAQTAVKPAGSGTASDPYQIATLDNLYWLSQADTAWGRDYIQTADINAADTKNWDSGRGFSPIGGNLWTELFSGSYNGQGHTIDKLYINRTVPLEGLFGETSNAKITNLGILNVRINGNDIGVLVGYSDSSTVVSNSYSTGIVYVNGGDVGCLVCWNVVGSKILNSYSTVTVVVHNEDVVGNAFVGGLVAINEGMVEDSYVIDSVFASGGETTSLGGLVGLNDGGVINTSYSRSFISDTNGSYVGGLVGFNGGVINTSYSRGFISDTDGSYVGGLVGENGNNISNSYSRDSLMSGSANIVGGLVGCNLDTISNSYSTGLVIGVGNVGGLVGSDSIGIGYANNSFWDTQTSGQSYSANGTGETTADMKTKSTFTDAGWDFTTIWNIDPDTNEGYPYLRFQTTTGISQISFKSKILVYAYNNDIYIQAKDITPLSGKIVLYNIQGQVVYQGVLNGTFSQIVSPGLKTGIYIVQLKMKNGVIVVKKVIINS